MRNGAICCNENCVEGGEKVQEKKKETPEEKGENETAKQKITVEII
ncbi:hypothetical protein ES703_01954 [subsurface metagenome]